MSAYSYPSRPGDVASLDGLRSFPRALAAVAILLGSAVLLNMLARDPASSTARAGHAREPRTDVAGIAQLRRVAERRRRGRQFVLGTAAGVAAGAAVWIATTDGIGVATDVNRPLAAIGVWSSIALAARGTARHASPGIARVEARRRAIAPPRVKAGLLGWDNVGVGWAGSREGVR